MVAAPDTTRPTSPSWGEASWRVASAWTAPLWAGVWLAIMEWRAAAGTLPGELSSLLLAASCLCVGLLASALVAWPLTLVRAGVAATLRGRGSGAAAGRRRWAFLLVAGALFAFAVRAVAGWLQLVKAARAELVSWVAVAVLMLAAFASIGAAQAMQRLSAVLARRAPLLGRGLPWAAAAALLAAHSVRAWPLLFDALSTWPVARTAAWSVWLLLVSAGMFADVWLPRRLLIPCSATPAVLLVVSLGWSMASLPDAPSTRAALSAAPMAHAFLRRAAAMGDRDGDGHAAFLGADCDDADAAVRPGALEQLGTDRDEDCDGVAWHRDPTQGTLGGKLDGAACRSEIRLPRTTNVLWIVVDAARADRLTQPKRDVMPRLRELAQRSIWFDRCYTPHPSTAYALPALFTGLQTRWARDLMASQHAPIAPNRTMPQTMLAKRGYATAAVYSHPLAGHHHQITRGMRQRKDRSAHVSSAAVASEAERFIRSAASRQQPFFVYAHFYDPHWSYERHAGVPWEGVRRVDRYDGELWHVDRHIGGLIDVLDELELSEQTIVMVVSDHGEEFGEHGGEFHGQSVFEEVVRIPCVMRVPTLEPRRVQQPVSLVDMLPTLVDLLTLENEPMMQGVSLEPLMLGRACSRGPVVGEMQPWTRRPPFKPWLWFVVDGDHKLIFDVDTGSYLLFDLGRDPAERRNLQELEPEVFARMRELLHHEVVRRIALPLGSQARERLAFGPLPKGIPR